MKFDIEPMMKKGDLLVKKYTPEILVYTGIGGMGISTVMACKATRKIDPVLETHKKKVEAVHKRYDVIKNETAKKKAITKVYAETCLEFAKLYGPSVVIGILSAAGILAGNHKLRKYSTELAAAYATIHTSFKQYRGRVVEKYGEEVDQELRFGSHQEKIEVVETDENGKEKKVKKTVTVMDSNSGLSDYARYFAYGEARAAEPNHDYNMMFLKAQQELANHMVRANGHLFLNEVYDMLGYDRSKAGQIVGWVHDASRNDHGDNYVDFGIREVYRKLSDAPGDFEKVILLDFNVDGNILEHAQEQGLITAW